MAGRSKKWNKQNTNSSSSSSENAADPDYSATWTTKLPQRNNFTCISEYSSKNGGLKSEVGASAVKRKRGRPSNKSSQIQEEKPKRHTLDMATAKSKPVSSDNESSTIGKKRSSLFTRNGKLNNKIVQGNGCSTSTSYGVREETDQENHRCFPKGNRICKNENDQRKMKATIFSWLIDSDIIEENKQVFCVDEGRKKKIKKGIIRREGILCVCCNRVFTAADFHSHVGGKLGKPYENIFVAKKHVSLLSCMIEASNKSEESERHRFNIIEAKGNARDLHDDACMICADGGNLICCEDCNSTYHQVCMDMEEVPEDSWYCPYCVCKFCGDPVPENDYLLTCPQCDKKYHWNCHQQREPKRIDLNSTPCAPYCEWSCKEIYEKLEKNMVGVQNELDEGYSWSLLRRMDHDFGIYIDDTHQRTVCHSKLAVAWRLMQDCFEPILDRHTRINVIQNVVYNCGANFNRINFRSFYTAVLEKDDEIISVASLRIHGTKLAEMPFIATRDVYRGKGMCRKLMIAIESALCYLNVENLVIPSTSERIGTWIERYGFRRLEATLKKEIICRNTLMFHDSIRLRKTLLPSDSGRCYKANMRAASLRKAGNNSHQDGVIYKSKLTMPTLLDLNIKPPE